MVTKYVLRLTTKLSTDKDDQLFIQCNMMVNREYTKIDLFILEEDYFEDAIGKNTRH